MVVVQESFLEAQVGICGAVILNSLHFLLNLAECPFNIYVSAPPLTQLPITSTHSSAAPHVLKPYCMSKRNSQLLSSQYPFAHWGILFG